MTTIVSALNRAARQCSVNLPSSWVSATRTDHVEIRDDFLLETVEDLQDRIDLPSPIGKQTTLTGGSGTTNADGSETFSLPSDFRRFQREQLALYDQDQDRPVVPVSDDGMWNHLTDVGAAGAIKYYRLEGYDGNWTVDIYNAPGTGSEITVSYISKNWMATSGGTAGDEFTAETDVLLFPRRVIEAGIVWRSRERRGVPYEDKYAEYEALVSRLSNDRRNRRVISIAQGDKTVRWQDLVPSFIPSS